MDHKDAKKGTCNRTKIQQHHFNTTHFRIHNKDSIGPCYHFSRVYAQWDPLCAGHTTTFSGMPSNRCLVGDASQTLFRICTNPPRMSSCVTSNSVGPHSEDDFWLFQCHTLWHDYRGWASMGAAALAWLAGEAVTGISLYTVSWNNACRLSINSGFLIGWWVLGSRTAKDSLLVMKAVILLYGWEAVVKEQYFKNF